MKKSMRASITIQIHRPLKLESNNDLEALPKCPAFLVYQKIYLPTIWNALLSFKSSIYTQL